MPFGDGTGPAGMGPMTGRVMGYCAGYPRPGYANPSFGYGAGGRGFGGGGRGWRHWHYATGMPGWMRVGWPGYSAFSPNISSPSTVWSKDQETEMLKNQADNLRNALDEIEKRLAELESSGDQK